MSLIFNVIYAASARGTHHKLALDALNHLKGPNAELWRRLFLKHAALYVQGSTAPDTEFKDFRNHVLHVRDDYWGGAVDKVEGWFEQVVHGLRDGRWEDAVWAAGVLSHYYTDPLHPFHTAQSEAENNIHRAVEWSISRSYDSLRKLGLADSDQITVAPGAQPGWLRAFVVQGAELSNQHYERLMAHYDIHRGMVDPPAGLDQLGRRCVAGLLIYAAKGHAALLDAAFAQAKVEPPRVSVALDAVLAALKVPIKRIGARLADAEERRLIERIYDELTTTGRVEQNLPADDRAVREAYRKEVLEPQMSQRGAQRQRLVSMPPARARRQAALAAARRRTAPPSIPPAPAKAIDPERRPTSAGAALQSEAAVVEPVPTSSSPSPASPIALADRRTRSDRVYLTASDDVSCGPSIGPNTAEQLYAIGIHTVSDLLAGDPADIAARLDVRHISRDTVRDWRDQAVLVMSVPGLRGGHAQLLVGAGLRGPEKLAAVDPNDLLVAVLAFARTREGERVLRDSAPPDLEQILGWVARAKARRAVEINSR